MGGIKYQRRQRTTFDKHQLDALQEAFKQTHYPEAHFREQLARKTNLDPSRIQVWFQNQRAKDRKRRGLVDSDDDTHSPLQRNQHSNHHHHHHHHLAIKYSKVEQPIGNNNWEQQLLRTNSIDQIQQQQQIKPFGGGRQSTNKFPTQFESFVDELDRQENERRLAREDVCVFSSVIANEAAKAVSEGKFDSILHYHRSKYSDRESLETYYTKQINNNFEL